MSDRETGLNSRKDLTLPMLRLLSSKALGRHNFWKPSKPCHIGFHWIALTEYSHMSTHVPLRFQSFFRVFCIILYWPNQPTAALGLSKSKLNLYVLKVNSTNTTIIKRVEHKFCQKEWVKQK